MGLKAELYAVGEYDAKLADYMEYGEVPEGGRTIVYVLDCATRDQSEELADACGLERTHQNTVCKAPDVAGLPWVHEGEQEMIAALRLFGFDFYYRANG